MTDNFGQSMGVPQPGTVQAVSDGEATAVFTPFDVVQPPIQEVDDHALRVKHGKHRVIWPWIVLGVVVVLGALFGGGFWFFQSHALPGVTLWGNPVMGQSQSHIAAQIDDAVNNATVSVKYEGKTAKVSLKDMGLSVDSDAIASDVVNAKRGDAWWQQYAFWVKKNVTVAPASAGAADNTTLNAKLGVNEVKPVDAKVQLNADGNGFDVVAGQQGEGIEAKPVAQAALASVKTLGDEPAKAVTVALKNTEPAVTDDVANNAKATLDSLIANPVAIKVADHQIAAIDAQALAASTRIDANKNGKLQSGETRNGYVVFNASKIQQYYDDSVKPNLHTDREDRDVIVNNDNDVLQVIKEGHDGVTIASGADSNIGKDAVEALAKGSGSVSVDGTVDPMQTKSTKRHVVVDLSDRLVHVYENGQEIKTFHASVGQDNNRTTGVCEGDLCTPTGDFKVWLKYPTQDMSGNLTLSDGSVSHWSVKGVGDVNYFSKDGCAIHRIAKSSFTSDASIANMNNISHGCVGIGWDVSDWFYDWCLMGTTVHVQL
ncbi:L,D-transpeptidase [Bifidobacterium imperatoris]|uniref:L,D-transpeptidase n=1 Tax=Bifidobacterium imperatoris TaxID=2020965 RepID=A0A2N5IQB1_9BIFI|nr:L,D-transpeptidase [Bifidobacterium imperatoris]PLS24140.1 L,D-transpeptidase catalytic domain-containing protein [Bifidobacterium imperatoris]QSY57361.1 L,D-transpeptidase [Bifidobacterium imperatoris]